MLTPYEQARPIVLRMAQVVRIHSGKTPIRMHYIREWAKKRGLKQADIVRQMPADQKADKSTVSRWFKGSVPTEKHLVALVGILEAEEPAQLFRHPDDDWIAGLLRGRSEEERQKIAQVIEITFPRRTGTGG